MSDYWKKLYNSVSLEEPSLFKQVGKTANGAEISQGQLDIIVNSIVSGLQLKADDSVLDLCCGNGLVTRKISELVRYVEGIDFSEGLISVAQKVNQTDKIKYFCGDVVHLHRKYVRGKVKFYMNESLQHFVESQFEMLLSRINPASAGSLFFLSGVPDRELFETFYDTKEKMAYQLQREKEGRPHVGHWWFKSDLARIADSKGFSSKFLCQNPILPTSSHRFNVLLEKL